MSKESWETAFRVGLLVVLGAIAYLTWMNNQILTQRNGLFTEIRTQHEKILEKCE